MTALSVSMPPAMAEQLRAAAEETGIPMSRLIRQGLRLRFAELRAAGVTVGPAKQPRAKRRVRKGPTAAT